MQIIPLELSTAPQLTLGEWILISYTIAVFFFDLLMVGYILYHREYKPLKAKQLDLVILSLIAGWFYMLGTLQARWVLPHSGVFSNCAFWGIAAQLMLGGYLWIVAVLFRLYRLNYILLNPQIRKKARHPAWMYLRLFLFWVPGILLCLIAIGTGGVSHDSLPKDDGTFTGDMCHSNKDWTKGFLGLALVYFLVMLYYAFRLRNIRLSFNEFAYTKYLGVVVLVAFSVYGIVLMLDYDYYLWGRIVIGYIVLLCTQAFFCFQIGSPVWGCMFDRENYAHQFRMNMSKDATPSARKQQQSSSKQHSSQGQSHHGTENEKRDSIVEMHDIRTSQTSDSVQVELEAE
ncbi:hypothetical protein CAOG_08830 [Capsaspora owczarzaki ATCC 30864]|nr:hypothetical protein CAOG_08830 [Capsaspora owczarzaki ATCC 30864]|eukprot:XP_011270471.1 hypothetical protein CAOG_08830 [Capsaspora owczarzaki ATCC 30864]